jgi:hypothetical protein
MRQSIAALAILIAGAVAAQPTPPPKVLVRFVVESELFREDLGADRARCEAEVAGAMRTTLAEVFPFLDWVTAGPAEQTLTATLRDQAGSGDLDAIVVYEGSVASGNRPSHKLYNWFDPRDRDPEPLIADLRRKMAADIRSSQRELKEYFAGQVPLARRVDVDTTHQRVIIPVSNVDANLSSVLRVNFERANFPGFMFLGEAQPASNGIVCAVTRFSHGSKDVNRWDGSIPSFMQSASKVLVLMAEYRQSFAGTDNGSVTNPR